MVDFNYVKILSEYFDVTFFEFKEFWNSCTGKDRAYYISFAKSLNEKIDESAKG